MMGIKLQDHKEMSKNKDISTYNKPQYVYIPLINGNDTDITVLVKKGDYVLKGSHIGKRKGNFKIPIISTVSGTVVDLVAKTYLDGREIKCVKIENDFKEKSISMKIPKKITKQQFVDILHDSGIIGLGGAGFPTYIKYDTEKKIKTLLINAVECEPYITADYETLKNHPEEILEAIDMTLEVNNIDEAVIAIKKNNLELIKILNNFIGTYLKIRIELVPNIYPMGYERTLIKQLFKMTYKNLPVEKGIIVNNVATMYAIYEVFKLNKPFTDRLVTFTGEMFDSPQNINVKIGMEAKEVIGNLIGYNSTVEYNFIAGGPMMGSSIGNEDLIISPNLNCVLVINNKNDLPIECLRCGKCIDVCPVKLCPVIIKDKINSVDELKKLQVQRCIECGLCSYICPSKILVREYVKEAKNKVRGSDKK